MSLQNSALMHNMIPEFSIISCYIHSLHVQGPWDTASSVRAELHYFAPVFSLLETVPGTQLALTASNCEMSEGCEDGMKDVFQHFYYAEEFWGTDSFIFVFLPLFLYFLKVWLLKFYGFKINTRSKQKEKDTKDKIITCTPIRQQ